MQLKRDPKSPTKRPWHPADYDVATIYALKALAEGSASEGQQRRAYDWIVRVACQVDGETFMPDSERETAYASGKRYVALQIRKLATMPNDVIERLKANESKSNG